MTVKQLFNVIDGADDKFLKEAMEDDIQYPMPYVRMENAKRRSPKRAIAIASMFTAAAVCLAVIGGILVKSKLPFFGNYSAPFASIMSNKLVNSKLTNNVDDRFGLAAEIMSVDPSFTSIDRYTLENLKYDDVSAELTFKFDPELITELGEIPVRFFTFADDMAIMNKSVKGTDYLVTLDESTNDFTVDKKLLNEHPDGETNFTLNFNAPKDAKQFTFAAVLFPGEMCAINDTLGKSPSLLKAVTVESPLAGFDDKPVEPVFGAAPEIITNDVSDNQILYQNDGQVLLCCDYEQGQNDYFVFALYDGKLYKCFNSEFGYYINSYGYTYKVTGPFETVLNGAFYYGLPKSSFKSGTHTLQLVKVPVLNGAAAKGGYESGIYSTRYIIDTDETRKIEIKYVGTPEKYGMKLTTVFDKQNYNTDEEMHFTVIVKNLSERDITLCTPHDDTHRHGKLYIQVSSGAQIPTFISNNKEPVGSRVTLKPNEEYTLEGTFNLTLHNGDVYYYNCSFGGRCNVIIASDPGDPGNYTSFSTHFSANIN